MSVVVALECPSALCTVTTSQPAAIRPRLPTGVTARLWPPVLLVVGVRCRSCSSSCHPRRAYTRNSSLEGHDLRHERQRRVLHRQGSGGDVPTDAEHWPAYLAAMAYSGAPFTAIALSDTHSARRKPSLSGRRTADLTLRPSQRSTSRIPPLKRVTNTSSATHATPSLKPNIAAGSIPRQPITTGTGMSALP